MSTGKKFLIAVIILVLIAAIAVLTIFVFIPKSKYDSAVKSLTLESYDSAIETFEQLGDYKDSLFLLNKAKVEKTKSLIKKGNYEEAVELCNALSDYDEHSDLVEQLVSAILYDSKVNADMKLKYIDTIDGLPVEYQLPIANSKAKLLYTNIATYCTQSEIAGSTVEEGWYFFAISDKTGEKYEEDGKHLQDAICSLMGDTGGYAAVYITNRSAPREAYWSKSTELNSSMIVSLQLCKANDGFVYGSYPIEVIME